jgi:hypothetical protein
MFGNGGVSSLHALCRASKYKVVAEGIAVMDWENEYTKK